MSGSAAAVVRLAEFLLARIDGDEQAGRARPSYDEGRHEGGAAWELDPSPEYLTIYISPGRVLAECDAKRRIIEWHKIGANDEDGSCHRWYGDGNDTESDMTCQTLRALALPYADHPDYREEWRP